MQILAVLYTCG